jgi:ribosomal protein L32
LLGHDAALLVRGSFYLFLFELAGEAGVLASLNEEGADVYLAKTLEAPDAEVVAAAELPVEAPPETPAVAQPEELAEEATMVKERRWLVGIESGPLKGQRFPLGECLKIGRAAENDLVLADTQVSRRHATIQKAGAGYQVTDLRSGNGTLVNEALITGPMALKLGDVVQIGETRITLLGPAGNAPLPLEESTQMKAAVVQPPAPVKATPKPTEVTQPPVHAKEASRPVAPAPALQPAVRRCPHCGATLKPAARFCGSCGKPVPADEPVSPAAAAPAAPARVCPKCGEPARPGVNFCKKCGTRL